MIKNVLIASSFALVILSGCANKNDVALIEQDGKYGVIKNDGNTSVKPIYEELTWFDDSNNKNIKVEHPHYFNIHWFHNYAGENEYAIAKIDGKYGVIDKDNKILVKPIYDSISKLFNGYSVIKKDGMYGYLNKDLNIVKEPVFKDAKEFLNDATFVQSKDLKWACITKEMKMEIKPTYDEVYNFNDGLSRVKKDNNWGFVNEKCEEIVKPTYEYAYEFLNEYAKVVKNGKVLFIDNTGKEITKKLYNDVANF